METLESKKKSLDRLEAEMRKEKNLKKRAELRSVINKMRKQITSEAELMQ